MAHYWGDEDFDWNALNHCVHLYDHVLKKYGRMCVHTKEKYGSMRLQFVGMGWGGIYGFIKPGHLFFRWTSFKINKTVTIEGEKHTYQQDFLMSLNEFTETIAKYTGIRWLIHKYQMFLFNMLTLYCVRKYPHIKDEIMEEWEFERWLYGWVKKKVNYVCRWRSV